MKKFSILVASVAAALAFSSCETSRDDNPVLPVIPEGTEADFLNVPVLQNEYIDLTAENEGDLLLLTCSQPVEYGYAASVRYYPEIAMTPTFEDYRSYSGDWSSECDNLQVTNKNVAEAICEIMGYKDVSELPAGYFPVYVRMVANVYTDKGAKVPNTTITSNVVSFNNVGIKYLAKWVGGVAQDLYVVGSMSNWDFEPEYQFYTGEEKDSWITNSISIAAGEKIKVSPHTWNTPFNGVASFNAGGEDGAIIENNTAFTLFINNDSKDITVKSDFSGHAEIKLVNADYVLTLVSE